MSLEEALYNKKQVEKNIQKIDFLEHDAIKQSMRDSLIQRFEFSVDLFWKYIKKYMEAGLVNEGTFDTPRSVVAEAARVRILSEEDAEAIMNMIKNRNLTSHIYKEETADMISASILQGLELLKKYLKLLIPQK